MADKAYDIVKEYMAGYFTKQAEEEATAVAKEEATTTIIEDKAAHVRPAPAMKNEDAYHHAPKEVAPHHVTDDSYDDLPF
jgi:hypothetical protein